jgi:predicted short-subunit dehydrogenase-like oxidoreductase (DUF2520 family)
MIRGVTIIGTGRVGGAIAKRLHDRGVMVHAIAHRDFATWLGTHASVGQALILAVSDAAMSDVVRAIAASTRSLIDVVALHVNGSLRPYVLQPLTAMGATIASAHPFQTFATDDPTALDGIGWGVECTDDDWPLIDRLVQATGGLPVRLTDMTDDRKRMYHAAAVAASNFTYAAYQLGRDLADVVGIPADVMLPPIMQRTCSNAIAALQTDAPFGMTGPIVRGDVEGVQRQLDALPAEQRLIFAQLGLALVEVVTHRHSATTIDAMRDVLRKR